MPIEINKHSTVITGKGIHLFTLLSLRMALKLHAQGLKSRVSPIRTAHALGFKARTAKALLPEVQAAIDELDPKVIRVVNE